MIYIFFESEAKINISFRWSQRSCQQ